MQVMRVQTFFPLFAAGAIASSLLVAAVRPAQAQTGTLAAVRKFSSGDNHNFVYFDSSFGATPGTGSILDLYVGAQAATLTTAAGTSSFDAYCVDILAPIVRPSYTVTLKTLSDPSFTLGRPGVNSGGGIAWLYNNNVSLAANDPRSSAALQLAIWEAEYDWNGTAFTGSGANAGIDLSAGSLRYDSNAVDPSIYADIAARASTMLSGWQGRTDDAAWLDGRPNQGMVGPGVPEPGSLALLASGGLTALGLLRRRKNRA